VGELVIYYLDGSSGSVQDSSMSNKIHIEDNITISGCTLPSISLDDCHPVITNNTFTSEYPLSLDADFLSNLSECSSNIYSNGNPKISLDTYVDSTVTLSSVDGITSYALDGYLDVNSSGNLTISPGVKIYSKYGTYNTSCDIRVNGTLDADGAIFYNRTSSSTNFRLLIRENAVCNIDSCEVGELVIYYLDGSSGSVLSSSMGTFYIYDTAAFFKCNNFSLSTIILYGDPTSVLFLEDNYWGTTDPVIIETKITHHVDDPNRVVLQTELDISEN
jgi:hypothetical protein